MMTLDLDATQECFGREVATRPGITQTAPLIPAFKPVRPPRPQPIPAQPAGIKTAVMPTMAMPPDKQK